MLRYNTLHILVPKPGAALPCWPACGTGLEAKLTGLHTVSHKHSYTASGMGASGHETFTAELPS